MLSILLINLVFYESKLVNITALTIFRSIYQTITKIFHFRKEELPFLELKVLRDQWRALVNMLMNLWVVVKLATFSRKAQLHGVR
jgi:aminopeptidase-like protein